MPTANNQKLNRGDEGQAKQNYSAVRYGTDKGSIKFGVTDKKAVVTSGVQLDTPDGRHQLNLEIDGERKGWTSSTSPGNFQVECGSDREEADDTLQESIDARVTTPPSAIQRQGTDINSNDPRLNIPGAPDNLT